MIGQPSGWIDMPSSSERRTRPSAHAERVGEGASTGDAEPEDAAPVKSSADSSAPEPASERAPNKGRFVGLGAFSERLIAAHFLAYPLVFAVAVATISLAVIGYKAELLAVAVSSEPASNFQRWLLEHLELSPVDAKRFEIVMGPVAVTSGVIFAIAHFGAIPWALAAWRQNRTAEPKVAGREKLRRGFRIWLLSSVGPTALLLLVGAVGWLWILVK